MQFITRVYFFSSRSFQSITSTFSRGCNRAAKATTTNRKMFSFPLLLLLNDFIVCFAARQFVPVSVHCVFCPVKSSSGGKADYNKSLITHIASAYEIVFLQNMFFFNST